MASLFDPLYEVGTVAPPSSSDINKKLNEFDLLGSGTMTDREMYKACQQIQNLGFEKQELIDHVKKGPTVAGDGKGQIKISEFGKYLALESQKKYKQSAADYSNPFASDAPSPQSLTKTTSKMKVMVTPSPNDVNNNDMNGHKVDMSASYSPTEATETDIPNWFGHSLDTVVNHPNDPSIIPTDDPFDFLNTKQQAKKKKIVPNHMSVATQDIFYDEDDNSTVDQTANLSPKRAKIMKSVSTSGLLPAPRSKGDKPRKSKSKKKLKLKKHHSAALSFDTDVFADAPTDADNNKMRKKLQLAKAHSEMAPESSAQRKLNAAEQNGKKKRNKIDAIKEMRRGAAMLKYGRKGFPHFRRFQISHDKSKLIWYSRKKKLTETHVAIKDMKEILAGQQTEVFEKCTQKTLEKASFSIIYGSKLKSLDVVAKSAEEAMLWVKGIKGLMKANKQGKLHKVVMILVDVDYKDITKTKYKMPTDEERRKYGVQFSNRTELLHVVESTMKEAGDGFDGLNKAVQNENIKQSVEYENICVMMSEIEQRLGEIKYGIENKIADLNDLKRDVWVLKVDVTVLEEKLKVLSKIKSKHPI